MTANPSATAPEKPENRTQTSQTSQTSQKRRQARNARQAGADGNAARRVLARPAPDALPVREADRGAAPAALPGGARGAGPARRAVRRGRPGRLLLRPHRGHPGHLAAGRPGRRRGRPDQPARRLHRRLHRLPGRPGAAGVPEHGPGDRAVEVLRARRVLLRAGHDRVVPDADAPARGALARRPAVARGGRPARAAARARLAHGRPDPRAQQPGRGRRPRDGDAARAGRGHARQAEDAGGRQVREGQLRLDHRASAARGRAGRQGAQARPARGVGPGRRDVRLARGARHLRRLAALPDVRAGRPDDRSGSIRCGRWSARPCSSPRCGG